MEENRELREYILEIKNNILKEQYTDIDFVYWNSSNLKVARALIELNKFKSFVKLTNSPNIKRGYGRFVVNLSEVDADKCLECINDLINNKFK